MRFRILSALIVAQMAFSVPMIAQAHAEYDHSDPATGATVAAAPATVTVVFTEELVSQGSSLEVRDSTNTRVDTGNSQVVNATPKNTMTIGLKPGLPPGSYTVAWTTLSADDGDKDSGTFSFSVGVPAPAPAATTPGEKRQDIPAGPSYDITGTVVSLNNNTMMFVTSDVTGQPVTLRLDAKDISRKNITVGDSLSITIGPRQNDIPLIWTVVSQGSRVMENDFGARADFETKNEASEVQNRPDDDEARAKAKHEHGKED
jgi:methionine-rich copper-binding protein CopC